MRYTLKRDDIPLLSQWIKKKKLLVDKIYFFFGGDVEICTPVLNASAKPSTYLSDG